jgi:hypothetical protein
MTRLLILIVGVSIATGTTLPGGAPVFALPNRSADPGPFTSNGCSGFREAKFFGCCYTHDFAFWAGGNRDDRRRADKQLRQCLIDVTRGSLYDRIIADIGYMLLAMERIPGQFVRDGWGRAWHFTGRRKYEPLSPAQKSIVETERRRVCRSLTLDPATHMYRVNETQQIGVVPARGLCGELLSAAPSRTAAPLADSFATLEAPATHIQPGSSSTTPQPRARSSRDPQD